MDSLLSLSRAALPSLLIPFVTLSHQVPAPEHPDSFPSSTYHNIGRYDACLVLSIIAFMAVLRDVVRLFVLEPFARWKLTRDWKKRRQVKPSNASKTSLVNGKVPSANGGIHHGGEYLSEKPSIERLSEKAQEPRHIKRGVTRFAEQGWVFIYYVAQFCFGLYIYWNLPSDPWIGYPHIHLAAPVKLYYLGQIAFYCHSVLVLNAEERRNDHWRMNAHHVITIALMILSYTYNFTHVGCLIMVIMDWCDVVLPFAKMLRYLGYQTACDIAFVTFMLSWLFTRHYLFVGVVLSTAFYAPTIIPFDWQPERGHYFTAEAHMGFVVLLVSLEVLQIVWCYTIFSVAWRVVSGQGADDARSDDESDDDVKKER